ncbi:MAG TPA: CBS domain-containing protein [Planctomycetota bacterium]|nr:CBS domain-containing protein [Planctomycetota bacterium]
MDVIKCARIPPVLAVPEMSVREAVALMAKFNVGAVVVVNSNRNPVGIFTERDNLLRVTHMQRDPNLTLLSGVMTSPVDTVSASTQVEDALWRMIRKRYRHLPIVDTTRRVIGIVSVRYLLMRRLSEQEASLEIMDAYAHAGGPG